jgi:hypothetical protein
VKTQHLELDSKIAPGVLYDRIVPDDPMGDEYPRQSYRARTHVGRRVPRGGRAGSLSRSRDCDAGVDSDVERTRVLIDTLLEVMLIPSSFCQRFPGTRSGLPGRGAWAKFGLKDAANITKNILVFPHPSTTAPTTVAPARALLNDAVTSFCGYCSCARLRTGAEPGEPGTVPPLCRAVDHEGGESDPV